ncbi:MAG: hypothetical protein UR39_C0005G0069 [Candidatus Woesebacteria bacterium GW2011_GWA1_33_30]|uniref:Uncharacterized protein n=1 Tax=Candidatus Woesebacteria bacterium GW2011_GWA2_33_28 TaxID=1618561 RepID=A0A0G0A7M5_9BACT|nr:MAG: hypothetical protein UR38_C0005G0069 [Candidatus Woesebacteria bacterium GW2011_GWA2_33_28]KKP48187.1 MAG: hypothetical protein UR39_C0005G0069 [Candidatus Woesebacteria bacterium GW2011_GWA1_33_30]KKP49429.1 MAG: hypothetical protein UR40_C0006G0069 [Microgenomates group bacterium GW2011_GWC1_33_32]KKP52155.1 MAG: hypothetical protein UR44_C0004G0069 [Candidatus Woesebacteria bacterium GW2011_GWB1_33_38]KKP56039.1 MAG: hypothetical protein UR48_C0042G0003 [Microgenomates group bacteriu
MEAVGGEPKLSAEENIIGLLSKHFNPEAAEIIFNRRFAWMRDDEVTKNIASSRGIGQDEAFEWMVLNKPDMKALTEDDVTETELKSFSKFIQDERRDVLQSHTQLKNGLSAHGKNTAGPNMDSELRAWGEKYERVRKASIGIAKKAIQKGFPVPKYDLVN